jgi:microcystin-dependent protein
MKWAASPKARQNLKMVAGIVVGAFAVQGVMSACGSVNRGGNNDTDGGLGVADAAGGAETVPAGTIVAFAGKTPPDGWLPCDGKPVARGSYSALYAAIGDAWGSGDGATTFNVPDLRGVFLRGVDGGVNRDPDVATRKAMAPGGNEGDAVGSLEGDGFRTHDHSGKTGVVSEPAGATNGVRDYTTTQAGNFKGIAYVQNVALGANDFRGHVHVITAQGGAETRPINAAVNYIIKI